MAPKTKSLLWTSKDGPAPRRAPKHKPDPLENFEKYQVLRAHILQGKMKPQEQVGIEIEPEDREATGITQPWRVVVDHLRKVLRDTNLTSDYRLECYKTDSEGTHWFVRVTYEPPIVAKKHA